MANDTKTQVSLKNDKALFGTEKIKHISDFFAKNLNERKIFTWKKHFSLT